MYSSGPSYTRLRSAYDDERFAPGYTWQTPWTPRISAVNGNIPKSYDSMANSNNSSTPARRNRYTRSSTSVTQLLTDSCSSLLQRLTTRVRGPSATLERTISHDSATIQKPNTNYSLGNSRSSSNLAVRSRKDERSSSSLALRNPKDEKSASNYLSRSKIEDKGNISTRSRLEDKYTSVLEKLYGRKRESERTLEPSVGRSLETSGRALSKSATTSNILLSEKSYPYTSTVNPPREKTPYKETKSQQRKQYPEPPYAYLDRDSAYRIRHRSNHSELRPRRSSKPQRKSECSDRKVSNLKLCPVEMPQIDNKTTPKIEDETTPTPSAPDSISEREAKRKEIQSLIMKYSALDEFYNRPKLLNTDGDVDHTLKDNSKSSCEALIEKSKALVSNSTVLAGISRGDSKLNTENSNGILENLANSVNTEVLPTNSDSLLVNSNVHRTNSSLRVIDSAALAANSGSLGVDSDSLGSMSSSLTNSSASLGTNTALLGVNSASLGNNPASLGNNSASLGGGNFGSLGTNSSIGLHGTNSTSHGPSSGTHQPNSSTNLVNSTTHLGNSNKHIVNNGSHLVNAHLGSSNFYLTNHGNYPNSSAYLGNPGVHYSSSRQGSSNAQTSANSKIGRSSLMASNSLTASNNSLSSSTHSLVTPYHGSVAASLAQKYHSRLASVVSNWPLCEIIFTKSPDYGN